jgi:hypothetical protein
MASAPFVHPLDLSLSTLHMFSFCLSQLDQVDSWTVSPHTEPILFNRVRAWLRDVIWSLRRQWAILKSFCATWEAVSAFVLDKCNVIVQGISPCPPVATDTPVLLCVGRRSDLSLALEALCTQHPEVLIPHPTLTEYK